ncbi:MAG: hypothetical protein V1821_00295 [bacterium]
MTRGGWLKIAGTILLGIILLPPSAQALTFSPERIFLEGKKGETLEASVELTNEENFPTVIHAEVVDFETGKEVGVPEFVPENIKNGLKLVTNLSATDFELPARGRKKFVFVVKIPEASRGSYFGAVHFSSSPKTGASSRVAVTGPLVFITVTGAADGLLTYQNQARSSFYFSQPLQFRVKLENHGSAFEIPEGRIVIQNFFNQPLAVYSLRDPGRVILPGESREIVFEAPDMEKGFMKSLLWTWGFGPYTASAEINYGQGRQLKFQAGNYWVISWPLVLASVLIAVFAVWVLGWHKKR